jgi:hypothetical protein
VRRGSLMGRSNAKLRRSLFTVRRAGNVTFRRARSRVSQIANPINFKPASAPSMRDSASASLPGVALVVRCQFHGHVRHRHLILLGRVSRLLHQLEADASGKLSRPTAGGAVGAGVRAPFSLARRCWRRPSSGGAGASGVDEVTGTSYPARKALPETLSSRSLRNRAAGRART